MKIIISAIIILTHLFSQDLFTKGVEEYNKRAIDSDGLIASSIYIDKSINLLIIK